MIFFVDGSRNRSGVGVHPGPGAAACACLRRCPMGIRGPPGPADSGRCAAEQWKIRDGGHRLVGVLGGKDEAHPAAQLVQAEAALRIVLAQQGGQPLAIGVSQRCSRSARLLPRHRYGAGLATTAVP